MINFSNHVNFFIFLSSFSVTILFLACLLRFFWGFRSRNQLMLWLAMFFCVISVSLQLVDPLKNLHTYIPLGLFSLIANIVGVFATGFMFDFVIYSVYGRKVLILLTAYLTLLIVVLVLILIGIKNVDTSQYFSMWDIQSRKTTPNIAYWIVLTAYELSVNTLCSILCLKQCKEKIPFFLKSSLLFFGMGCSLFCILMLISILQVLIQQEIPQNVYPVVSAIELICYSIGISTPIFNKIKNSTLLRVNCFKIGTIIFNFDNRKENIVNIIRKLGLKNLIFNTNIFLYSLLIKSNDLLLSRYKGFHEGADLQSELLINQNSSRNLVLSDTELNRECTSFYSMYRNLFSKTDIN